MTFTVVQDYRQMNHVCIPLSSGEWSEPTIYHIHMAGIALQTKDHSFRWGWISATSSHCWQESL